MRTSTQRVSGSEGWIPETVDDRELVLRQLDQLLEDPVFKRSKGCSHLLAHVVRRTLDGDAGQTKERTIGVEVFGRAPDYDTASDHVVRSTAGEVRKRLAQYYLQPEHSGEIRIDVPSGSYVARFARFVEITAALPTGPEAMDVEPVFVLQRSETPPPGASYSRFRRLAIAGCFTVAAIVSTIAIAGSIGHSSARAMDRFWQPLLQSPSPVLLCIGDRNRVGLPIPAVPPGNETGKTDPPFRGGDKVSLNDAITLAKVAGYLQQNGKSYRILMHSKVTFADLHSSPSVLIGFKNNYWTTNLAARLRFTVEEGPAHTRVMRDRKNPGRNDWSIDLSTAYDEHSTDYALVVRTVDPQTEQLVVMAAGMTHFGTLAACEFLTDPAQLAKLDAYGQKGWERKNIALVLSTEVIKDSIGAPKIVAADFW